MLVCSECGSYGVYVNLSVNVNDYYEGELRDAELGETICKACGNEGALGCFGTKEKDNQNKFYTTQTHRLYFSIRRKEYDKDGIGN